MDKRDKILALTVLDAYPDEATASLACVEGGIDTKLLGDGLLEFALIEALDVNKEPDQTLEAPALNGMDELRIYSALKRAARELDDTMQKVRVAIYNRAIRNFIEFGESLPHPGMPMVSFNALDNWVQAFDEQEALMHTAQFWSHMVTTLGLDISPRDMFPFATLQASKASFRLPEDDSKRMELIMSSAGAGEAGSGSAVGEQSRPGDPPLAPHPAQAAGDAKGSDAGPGKAADKAGGGGSKGPGTGSKPVGPATAPAPAAGRGPAPSVAGGPTTVRATSSGPAT